MASPAKASSSSPRLPATTPSKKLTKEEAFEQLGPPPHGFAWDEDSQQYLPLAEVVLTSRLSEPTDLESNLKGFERTRAMLTKFVAKYLIEAKYDGRGRIVQGQVNDWYKTGDGGKALTKRGAEKLGSLFRFVRAGTRLVSQDLTKEFTSATVECVLNDVYRRQVGSGVSSCNTAEASFQAAGARRKYGGTYDTKGKETAPPDYRAAQNDVTAKAGKRAFVQSIIFATGADEMFGVGTADEPGVEQQAEPERAEAVRLPKTQKGGKPIFGQWGGAKLSDVPADTLQTILIWCQKAKAQKVWAPLADAITMELDDRLQKKLATTEDDLPFPMDNPKPKEAAK